MLEWLTRCTPCGWNTAFEIAAITVVGGRQESEQGKASCFLDVPVDAVRKVLHFPQGLICAS
jgi:hypothetical protein